jgi:hypothetical protein
MKGPVLFLLFLNFLELIYSKNEELCNQVTFNIQIESSLNELEQDDPKLIAAIKKRLIQPPPKTTPYNFTK